MATGRQTPPPTRSGDAPPRPRSHRKNLFMFMCIFWEPPDVGLAPTGVWGSPPIPHCNWRTLPSSQTPSLPALSFPLPPTPLGSFCKAPGRGGPSWWGGGVLGRKGVEGGRPPSGTWGQTHIWGYSNFPFITIDAHCVSPDPLPKAKKDLIRWSSSQPRDWKSSWRDFSELRVGGFGWKFPEGSPDFLEVPENTLSFLSFFFFLEFLAFLPCEEFLVFFWACFPSFPGIFGIR